MSTTSISNWKRQFLTAAREGLAAGGPPTKAEQLAALQAEHERPATCIEDVTTPDNESFRA